MKRLDLRDLNTVLDLARARYLTIPQPACLLGVSRVLTEAERLAVAYIEAVLNMAGQHGLDTRSLVFKWDDSNDDPDSL